MSWPGALTIRTTGTLITASFWNEFVDALNYLGNSHQHTGGTDLGAGALLDGRILASDFVIPEIVNSSAEITLLSFTLAASAMGANQGIEIFAFFDALNNSGSNRTATVKLKYGATTVASDTSQNMATSANRKNGLYHFILRNAAATNSQVGSLLGKVHNDGGAVVYLQTMNSGVGAEDSTTALAVTVTFQWSAAHANTSLICQGIYAKGLYG